MHLLRRQVPELVRRVPEDGGDGRAAERGAHPAGGHELQTVFKRKNTAKMQRGVLAEAVAGDQRFDRVEDALDASEGQGRCAERHDLSIGRVPEPPARVHRVLVAAADPGAVEVAGGLQIGADAAPATGNEHRRARPAYPRPQSSIRPRPACADRGSRGQASRPCARRGRSRFASP